MTTVSGWKPDLQGNDVRGDDLMSIIAARRRMNGRPCFGGLRCPTKIPRLRKQRAAVLFGEFADAGGSPLGAASDKRQARARVGRRLSAAHGSLGGDEAPATLFVGRATRPVVRSVLFRPPHAIVPDAHTLAAKRELGNM